jgi:hypothetical protein
MFTHNYKQSSILVWMFTHNYKQSSNGNTYNYKTADSFPFKKIRNYDKMKDNINIHTMIDDCL